jgi:hypothetical protein
VEYVSYHPTPTKGELELGADNEVRLENIPPHSTFYFLYRIYLSSSAENSSEKSPRDSYTHSSLANGSFTDLFASRSEGLMMHLSDRIISKEIRLELNYQNAHGSQELSGYIPEHNQHFIEPFSWTHSVLEVGDNVLLQVTVENRAHIPLSVTDWELAGADVVEDVNQLNTPLRTGQQLFMALVLTNLSDQALTLTLGYKYAMTPASRRLYISSEIDEAIMHQSFKTTQRFVLAACH